MSTPEASPQDKVVTLGITNDHLIASFVPPVPSKLTYEAMAKGFLVEAIVPINESGEAKSDKNVRAITYSRTAMEAANQYAEQLFISANIRAAARIGYTLSKNEIVNLERQIDSEAAA